ncbi:MAG TPA: glycosyltransferase family 4 protein [Acidimicrobiales bacterium]|nr:glycosyltransferase family 4 protein [Acidimicrobiales bacterium]
MTHLLVTNDFPPKLGGIQSYLWELWRRLEPDRFEVLTTAHPDAAVFDAAQPFRVHRLPETQTKPTPRLAELVRERARAMKADLVVVDPAVPLGLVAPRLGLPYAVVLHGAEVTVPGRLPVSRQLLAHVIRRSVLVVAAGGYPAAEGERVAGAGRMPPVVVVPPGVDTGRFRPLEADQRREARRRFGLPPDGLVVVSVSRLVPRKGMDVVVRAAARLAPEIPGLDVAIAGEGRDRRRLERLVARTGAPVRLVGAVPDAELAAFYGCADLFCMLCRNRWAGLEQEGFGIVFLEAAAAGVAQVAGASGGADEAVVDGRTGLVVRRPRSVADATGALRSLLADPGRREAMGREARARAATEFAYDGLARRLGEALAEVGG